MVTRRVSVTYVSQYLHSTDSEEYSNNSKWIKGLPESKRVWLKSSISSGSSRQGWRLGVLSRGRRGWPGLRPGTRSTVRGVKGQRGQSSDETLGSGWEQQAGKAAGLTGWENGAWLCVVRVRGNSRKLWWFTGKGRKCWSVIREESFCVPNLLCECQFFTF